MTTVLVTGVFDLLHQEHLTFLKKAKQLGDRLVVGLEADRRVKRIKGENRPINQQALRQKNLEALKIADLVLILPEKFNELSDYRQFLQTVHPDILAVSSHTAHLSIKQRLMQEIGGKVVVAHQYNPRFSTSKMLAEVKE